MDVTERAARTEEINAEDEYIYITTIGGQRVIGIKPRRYFTVDDARELASNLESRAHEIDCLDAIDQLKEGMLVCELKLPWWLLIASRSCGQLFGRGSCYQGSHVQHPRRLSR